jgi:N-acetylneuraminate lyase
MTISPLDGLVAATHTPFDESGQLALVVLETQAEHLLRSGVTAAFVGGTTGESASLSMPERLALGRRWAEVVRGTPLRLVVHVGSNSLEEAALLAADAAEQGASAIAALAPSYFKPRSLDVLVACCRRIAGAAPETPFYFYDIPALTGVSLPMPEFLDAAADRVPTLAGLKFTNPDLMAYQRCLRAGGGRFDLPWGVDEYLLAALALGAGGAVGSSYNFAAPVYHEVIRAFRARDLEAARAAQYRSVQLITLLAEYGYMAAAKATMGFLGVPVGPPRLPNPPLAPGREGELRGRLERLGFFDWVAPGR